MTARAYRWRWRYDRNTRSWFCSELNLEVTINKDGWWVVYNWSIFRPGFWLVTPTGQQRRFRSPESAQRAAERAAGKGGG